ncbi:MAG: hypothetical protein J6K86_02995 [Clostridia bacterium]|nr:hypothetical protein [Clostridia bacterium]
MKIFPKVFKSNKTQKIYFQADAEYDAVEIKVQGMEYYTIPHTPAYRIDEEERYPYLPMQKDKEGVFFFEYSFAQEQKYSVKIKIAGEIVYSTYAYAINEDLVGLKPYKGDTHLHTTGSDGAYSPFETACYYREGGYDFIAITDHHKMYPSREGQEKMQPLTDLFTVFIGEEVHNKGMGYFHIVNFGGETSINIPILAEPDKIEEKVQEVLKSRDFTGAADPYACAYRIFVAEEIRKGGGLAIMAHPYWDCFGEYNMETEDFRYLWKNGCFDALEVLAGCDRNNNGNNLQQALWADMRAEGVTIPVVGASDCHDVRGEDSLFNAQFTIAFAKNPEDIKACIKEERAVAVLRREEQDFFVFGKFRYVKYARFLLSEYAPAYDALCKKHAKALLEAGEFEGKRTAKLCDIEREITEYQKEFFA